MFKILTSLLVASLAAEEATKADIKAIVEPIKTVDPVKTIEAAVTKVTYAEVLSISADNWKDIMMLDPPKTNLFVLFQDYECKECRRGATELAKLATALGEDQPKVARVDCHKDNHLCDTFGDKTMPFMLLISDNKIYKYNGAIDADAI